MWGYRDAIRANELRRERNAAALMQRWRDNDERQRRYAREHPEYLELFWPAELLWPAGKPPNYGKKDPD